MEGLESIYGGSIMPFILPMSNTTGKQFLDATTDIEKLTSNLMQKYQI